MASIRKHGKTWQARINRRGFPPQSKTFPSKKAAERWAGVIESEMARGVFTDRSEAERTTFSDILERYISEVSPTKRGGHNEIIRLKALKRHWLAVKTMAQLSPSLIAQYRDERLRSCSASTVVRELLQISSIINHSRREWGIAIPNPVQQVRKPSMPKGRSRILSAEEERRLMAELEPRGIRNPYMPSVVIVALETAMRLGELLSLTWDDIDLDRHVAHLDMTKNGEPRDVPLSARAVETLAAIPRGSDDRVFSINREALQANFKRAVRRAELKDLRFHDLRHTATTSLAGKLDNILELSAVTGHKELRMLKRYYHPRAEDIAKKLK